MTLFWMTVQPGWRSWLSMSAPCLVSCSTGPRTWHNGKTGIPTDRILISATHTHSAPAAMRALGCPADASYVAILPGRIAESIERAASNLEPARIGWTVIDDDGHTFCRHWIRRPDKMIEDPFGGGPSGPTCTRLPEPRLIGPAGPVDPALTLLSVQSRTGRPIAGLANYSMHYYGAMAVSADYFGRFATAIANGSREKVDPPFVGIMSQGTSGDQMWMDYGQPKKEPGIDAYAEEVAQWCRTGVPGDPLSRLGSADDGRNDA